MAEENYKLTGLFENLGVNSEDELKNYCFKVEASLPPQSFKVCLRIPKISEVMNLRLTAPDLYFAAWIEKIESDGETIIRERIPEFISNLPAPIYDRMVMTITNYAEALFELTKIKLNDRSQNTESPS